MTTLVASSEDVHEPRYVRYGWARYVQSYLFNRDGLPLGTFMAP